MNLNNKIGRSIQTLCVVFLFLLFAVCSFFLIMIAAANYRGVMADNDASFNSYTMLRYIGNKISSCDTPDGVTVLNDGEITYLSLKDTETGDSYKTLIYSYDGNIYEILVPADYIINPGEGQQLLKVDKFDINILDGKTAVLSAVNADNATIELCITLKCADFREEANNDGF